MSKTTDYVIERMNEQSHSKFWIKAEIKRLYNVPWFPGLTSKIKKLEQEYNLIQSHGGGITLKIKK